MALLDRFFGPKNDPAKGAVMPLYHQVVEKARQPHWYLDGGVPDNMDGRFEILTAILSLVMLRLEGEDGQAETNVYLTEIFVDDMDGQLREIGIGDMIVGKHMGKIMSVLGGRLSAYRAAIENPAEMNAAIARNIFAEESASDAAVTYLSSTLAQEKQRLDAISARDLIDGNADW